MTLVNKIKQSTTFKPAIFIPSLIFILLVCGISIFFPSSAQSMMSSSKAWIFTHFNWFYILAVSIFIIFLILLAGSRLGDIKLGGENEESQYPFISWMAMLFAAGMGIGLMYFGVAEPMLHYTSPLNPELTGADRIEQAMITSFYHWGVHAWSIYAVIGLALAYFGFRYKLPLTVRSGFYPLLKNRINGFWGNLIDIIALCSTVFGVTTTLGYGAMQLDAGLNAVGWLGDRDFTTLSIIIIVVMLLAMISAISGVGKGVRRLSEANLVLAGLLMLFVVVAGPTLYLFSAFIENFGNYLKEIVPLSFRTFANQPDKQDWFNGWTVLYWAWWVSWAPFVGLFIAKISRGRTIREFILGVLFVPSIFNTLWITIFGNAAIWVDINNGGVLSDLISNTEGLLFGFFDQLPGGLFASIIALLIISLFFITSADSGIYVINNIASQGKDKAPSWQSAFWAVLLIVLAIALLRSDGLGALQTMTLVIALPFTAILLLLCMGLWKGLLVDQQYFKKSLAYGHAHWDSANWKERLDKILTQHQRTDINQFFKDVVDPAFKEVAEEFRSHGLNIEIKNFKKGLKRALIIKKENVQNFSYGVEIQKQVLSEVLVEDDSLPHIETKNSYLPVTFFNDGRLGYDVQYMTKDELITDILKQYERYMSLVIDDSNNLMTYDIV